MVKVRYQYTHFIYPFIIPKKEYGKYIHEIEKKHKWRRKDLKKEKNIEMYSDLSNKGNPSKKKKELPYTIWEYQLEQRMSGKTVEKNGIFFQIQKIELICFKAGICFLDIKACIEEVEDFSEIINFNYKFNNMELSENIKIQTDTFKDIKNIGELVEEVTRNKFESKNFYTYSYTCIDSENWNDTNPFSKIENLFFKYMYIRPFDENMEFNKKELGTFSNLKYVKFGITEKACVLLTSTVETYYYTKLAEEYDGVFFYNYLFNLYKKYYLENIITELKSNPQKALKMLMDYRQNWEEKKNYIPIEEDFCTTVEEKLKITKMLDKIVKSTEQLEKKVDKMLYIVLIVSLGINLLNFVILIKNGIW